MEKKVKILVVDDEENVLDFLKEVVESQGYSFLSARSGREAMDKIKEARPNLVLLDVVMPGIDGLEVLRLIREEDKGLPVVMLTAYGTSERIKEAMGLNISGFIPKGASVKEAVSKIKTVLNVSLK
ncbi:MAG: response regulator [Candidatus Omnitrophica bacterium]|nr:response regulator [Candidatus Omnitrophota bacterium]